jgi:hypothetical protein
MSKMTPRQEAAYALDWDLNPADLKPAVQAEYYLLKQERLTNPAAGRPALSEPVSEVPKRKVYRIQRWLRLPLLIFLSLPALIGTMFLFPHNDGYRPNVFGVVLGSLILIFCLYYMAVLATTGLVATPDGLVNRRWLRRRSIDWSSVRSFEVAVSSGRWQYRHADVVVINLDQGRIETRIEGSRRYLSRVIEELRDWQSRADQPTG